MPFSHFPMKFYSRLMARNLKDHICFELWRGTAAYPYISPKGYKYLTEDMTSSLWQIFWVNPTPDRESVGRMCKHHDGSEEDDYTPFKPVDPEECLIDEPETAEAPAATPDLLP